jgi:hypothetical protein
MNGILKKGFLFLLFIPLLLFVFLHQADTGHNIQYVQVNAAIGGDELVAFQNSAHHIITYKAVVFRNRKGLRNEINICNPLREFNAVAKTTTETIEELIEHISSWIPRLYYEQFSVKPNCIIILETKINNDGKAEIRFGVAMECTPKLQRPKTIYL